MIKDYFKTLSVNIYKVLLNVLQLDDRGSGCYTLYASYLGKIWKTSNPHNIQTNNPKKLSLVQKKELFKIFLKMYHKCQKSLIKKLTKTLKKKKVGRAQSPTPNSLGWNKNGRFANILHILRKRAPDSLWNFHVPKLSF